MTERPDLALHQATIYGTKEYIDRAIQYVTEEDTITFDSVVHCLNKQIDEFTEEATVCGDCRNCEAYEITTSLIHVTPTRKVRNDKKQR